MPGGETPAFNFLGANLCIAAITKPAFDTPRASAVPAEKWKGQQAGSSLSQLFQIHAPVLQRLSVWGPSMQSHSLSHTLVALHPAE